MTIPDYFSCTPAETQAKIYGYLTNNQVMSSNFRALFTLTFNQWAKRGEAKTPERLWPLPLLDNIGKKPDLTAAEMYKRNKKISEWAESNWDRLFGAN